ncbi:MAG: fructose-6-phosphate aldolase [Candidatus Dadabacteria bacterium]|nr:MAG: fructose-6-phosphate aldolase [Candidatus Dadabacteria bacterium]
MKLFIDTADIEEIRQAASWGIIDGVTTNPSLVAKTGRRFEDVLAEICDTVDGPVSAEVISTEADAMVAEGRNLAAIHPNVVVKIPMTVEGIKATRRLADQGIAVNVTLVFQPGQGLLAAKAGAAYVSPFVGRLDDIGEDGMAVVASLVEIYSAYEFATEILVASVRRPGHVIEAAELGADIATCPLKVLEQLVRHPLTDIGLERFLADWRKAQN